MTLCGLSFKHFPCNGMDILDNAGYQKEILIKKAWDIKQQRGNKIKILFNFETIKG